LAFTVKEEATAENEKKFTTLRKMYGENCIKIKKIWASVYRLNAQEKTSLLSNGEGKKISKTHNRGRERGIAKKTAEEVLRHRTRFQSLPARRQARQGLIADQKEIGRAFSGRRWLNVDD